MASVTAMVRMPLQDCKCPVELLEQNHTRQFMRKRHLAQREQLIGVLKHSRRKPICGTYSEEQRLRSARLMSVNEAGKFLRRELLPVRVQQYHKGRNTRR